MVAAHDNKDGPALESRTDLRRANAVDEKLALTKHVFHRVGGKRLKLLAEPLTRLVELVVENRRRVKLRFEPLPRAERYTALVDLNEAPLANRREQILIQDIEHRDSRLDEDLGARVRVAPRDRR